MKAWLTPNTVDLTSQEAQRAITLPTELWPFVSGALFPLTLNENWEQFGDATPEETADVFRDMLFSFDDSQVGGGMNFISTTSYQLVSIFGHTGYYTLNITHADLPPESSGATGLLLEVSATFSAPSSFWVLDPPLKARQTYSVSDSPYTVGGYIWGPITNGICRVQTRNLNPVTVDLYVGLIGWV